MKSIGMGLGRKSLAIGFGILIMLGGLAGQPASAQRGDCDDIAEWYTAVGDLRQELAEVEAIALANGAPGNPADYATMADDLRDLEVPERAGEANDLLAEGYEDIAVYLEQLMQNSQFMAAGGVPTFDDYQRIVVTVSTARHQVLSGYLAWSQLGTGCELVDEFVIPADIASCEGVADFLNKSSGIYSSYWIFWEETYIHGRTRNTRYPGSEWLERNRDGTYSLNIPRENWGEVITPSELLSGFAYLHAQDLATTPASDPVLEIQEAVVTNLLTLSDLYLISMMGAFGGLLALDEAGMEAIFEQYSELSIVSLDQHEAIASEWERLAAECDVDAQFPELPGNR